MQRIVRSGVCRVGRVGFGREGRVCGDARINKEKWKEREQLSWELRGYDSTKRGCWMRWPITDGL